MTTGKHLWKSNASVAWIWCSWVATVNPDVSAHLAVSALPLVLQNFEQIWARIAYMWNTGCTHLRNRRKLTEQSQRENPGWTSDKNEYQSFAGQWPNLLHSLCQSQVALVPAAPAQFAQRWGHSTPMMSSLLLKCGATKWDCWECLKNCLKALNFQERMKIAQQKDCVFDRNRDKVKWGDELPCRKRKLSPERAYRRACVLCVKRQHRMHATHDVECCLFFDFCSSAWTLWVDAYTGIYNTCWLASLSLSLLTLSASTMRKPLFCINNLNLLLLLYFYWGWPVIYLGWCVGCPMQLSLILCNKAQRYWNW